MSLAFRNVGVMVNKYTNGLGMKSSVDRGPFPRQTWSEEHRVAIPLGNGPLPVIRKAERCRTLDTIFTNR
jgi:hypothetical protein